MFSNNVYRCVSLTTSKKFSASIRSFSVEKKGENANEMNFNEQQAPYYTAKDIEFCPNRAKDVMQNCVEASEYKCNDEPFTEAKKIAPSSPMSDADHMEAYKSGNSVSLYSVMQSNVPEPFSTKSKSPTHLNMPGSSCSQDYKYLSGKMQNTHQSKQ